MIKWQLIQNYVMDGLIYAEHFVLLHLNQVTQSFQMDHNCQIKVVVIIEYSDVASLIVVLVLLLTTPLKT